MSWTIFIFGKNKNNILQFIYDEWNSFPENYNHSKMMALGIYGSTYTCKQNFLIMNRFIEWFIMNINYIYI